MTFIGEVPSDVPRYFDEILPEQLEGTIDADGRPVPPVPADPGDILVEDYFVDYSPDSF